MADGMPTMLKVGVCPTAGASFTTTAASTQTIVLANTGNTSVDFNVSATPSGLLGGWITVTPTTGQHVLTL